MHRNTTANVELDRSGSTTESLGAIRRSLEAARVIFTVEGGVRLRELDDPATRERS